MTSEQSASSAAESVIPEGEGLTLREYQERAVQSDRLPKRGDLGYDVSLPLLGLVGEAGGLATELKRRERDAIGYVGFSDAVREELGDALWYIAVTAQRAGLSLSDVASSNLTKASGEYQGSRPPLPHDLYDDDVPQSEQLPRHLAVRFDESIDIKDGVEVPVVTVTVLREDLRFERQLGDPVDDNSDIDDFYRYHDALHLAHMAVLGWSPVVRTTLRPKLKRKTSARTDRVEDGGRAIVIEEGLTAAVFAEAKIHSYFRHAERVPHNILKLCMNLTSHLEVSSRTAADWRHAILMGYEAFNFLKDHHGGVLVTDMFERTVRTYTVSEYKSLRTALE